MDPDDVLLSLEAFQWDAGNSRKNREKHQVTDIECEEFFFNSPLIIRGDIKHSRAEKRYYALGQTDKNRKLFVVFTARGTLLRVISAREMTEREREAYRIAEEQE